MTKPNILNQLINPLYLQTYARYLPSAFDDSLSMLEKVDKVIISLNQIGKLTNDTVDQWNNVMDWLMADGLDASVDAKLDAMVTDGTLAKVINQDLFNSLQASITANTSAIAQNTASINTLTQNTGHIKYAGTPEDYGARGDGITDDTTAIQNCLNANQITVFKDVSYVVTKTLVLPENHSIEGNHAQLLVGSSWSASNNGASVPQNTVLYIKGRQPTWLSELDMLTSFVKDLRIRGVATLTSLVGIYCGASDTSVITQGSVVNYAVYGRNFENINIAYCANGLQLAEAWACQFTKVNTSHISQSALLMVGQVVNCTFVGCMFDTSGDGANGAFIDAGTYNGVSHRPEGNSFIGGFIGQANSGIHFQSGLAFKFTNVIVDLNGNNAVVGTDMSDVTFTGCYLYGQGTTVIALSDLASNANGTFVNFTDCNIVPVGTNDSASIGAYQTGVSFKGCLLTQHITYWANARGNVLHCIWNQNDTANPMVVVNTGATVIRSNNTFKSTGNAVA